MSTSQRIPLPHGLPTHLSAGNDGYEALCALLGVTNREHRQALANAPITKQRLKATGKALPRQTRTADRTRYNLLTLYGDPDVRRRIWRSFRDHEIPPKKSGNLFPSLERVALSQYDPKLLTATPDQEHLAESEAFYDPELTSDNWRTVALAALPHLNDDFANWASLPPERRTKTITAAFATATLLDDARLLHWAADLEDEIAHEYAFLIGVNVSDKQSTETSTDNDPMTEIYSRKYKLAQLQDRAFTLRDAAQNLADGPVTSELFDSLAENYAAVLELKEPALEASDTEAVRSLLSDFARLIDEKAKTAVWLAEEIESILTAWREAYQKTTGTRPDQIRVDIDRAIAALPDALDATAAAQSDEYNAKESLDRHEATTAAKAALSLADRRRQNRLADELSKSRTAVIDAMNDVVSVLKPHSNAIPLDPSPDDLTETGSAPAMTDGAAASPTSRELSGRKSETRTPASDDPGHTASVTDPAERPPRQEQSPAVDKRRSVVRSRQNGAPVESTPPPGKNLPTEEAISASENAQSVDQVQHPKAAPRDDPESEPTSIAATDADALSPTQAGVWKAIGAGRLGLAYHIARLDQAVGRSAQPSSELLAALALGTILSSPDDDLAAAYGKWVGALGGLDFSSVDPSLRDALNLLLFAATLRPALFAAQHGASIPLLRRVEFSGDLTPVYRLAMAVAEQAENLKTVHLDIPTLTAILDEGVWEDRITGHRDAVKCWQEAAGTATFLFAPASSVWQHWLRSKGILAELVRLLLTVSPHNVTRVREIADLFGNKKDVLSLIEDTDRNKIGRRGKKISGRALTQLESRLEKPRELARDWLRIVKVRPGGTGFLETTVEQLRKIFDQHELPTIQTISRIRETKSIATPLASALACTEQVIESLSNLFRGDTDAHAEVSLRPIQVLSDDLLYVTMLTLGENGAIDNFLRPADALALLLDTENHAEALADAFDSRLNQGDLFGAHAVYDRMRHETDPATSVSKERLERALAENSTSLKRQLYDLAKLLEDAFIIGEVSDADRAELTASIDDVRQRLNEPIKALSAGKDVEDIATMLEPARARAVTRIREQLAPHLPRMKEHERALVDNAIRSSNLATLYELLDYAKHDQPLRSPDAGRPSRLRSFMATTNAIESEYDGEEGPDLPDMVLAMEQREDMFDLRFSQLSSTQGRRAAGLVNLWIQIGRERSPDPERVAKFFAALGFTLTPGAVKPLGSAAALLRTERLDTRELCPTHVFGSDADGRYNLAFNRSELARDSIIQAIDTADSSAHTIILHFGKLSKADRNWLREWSINHSANFITIDDVLVLYLASLPEGRLRALFECTLPFTCAEPFFTASGLVPPEAFFGRDGERREVIDRYGSCFVYGGRQLGKTALLRSAEATFHEPGQRRLAKYMDLKYEDIGIAYGADHLWQVLWREFRKLEVVDHDTPTPRGHDSLISTLAKSIEAWLDAHEDGRILLLLDESDAFLAKDIEGEFRVSTRLKGLMDETERRFKVVLCGLHNVLRNTERANHPLAHFGEPVCVGPLLENGGLEQARALIRKPMAAVGYEFKTDNLITRILIWTNYYPSLIQLFGQALLRYLRQASDRDVPRHITDEDIETVFERHNFRDYIRDRFSLTLQLDERYEVIAYAMALDRQGELDRLATGLSNNRIFELACECWPEGFAIPKREFGTLLREMCGLGVLRQRTDQAGSGRYVFRNPNVLRLLGDPDTILNVLSKERELPGMFEASAFHAPYGGTKAGPPRLGPLTYEQEAVLNRGGRIAVLAGTPAANFADVDEFLKERVEQGRLRPLEHSMNANSLASEVKRLRPDRENYICLVDENEPWTLHWVKRVAEALHKVKRGRRIRVVFRADPDQLWRFISDLPDEYLHADNDLFDWVGIQPWNAAFLRHWCSDLGLHDASAKVSELLELTGGWPVLLERYAAAGEQSWDDRAAGLDQYIADHSRELLNAVGLGAPAARMELAPLHALDGLKPDEIDACAEIWKDQDRPPVTPAVLRRRLCWASQLGIMQDIDGSSVLNPLVARILPDDAA